MLIVEHFMHKTAPVLADYSAIERLIASKHRAARAYRKHPAFLPTRAQILAGPHKGYFECIGEPCPLCSAHEKLMKENSPFVE